MFCWCFAEKLCRCFVGALRKSSARKFKNDGAGVKRLLRLKIIVWQKLSQHWIIPVGDGIINAMIRMFSFAARKRLLNHFVRLALWYNVRKGLYRLRREEADIETPFD